jgi:hypothetical protein
LPRNRRRNRPIQSSGFYPIHEGIPNGHGGLGPRRDLAPADIVEMEASPRGASTGESASRTAPAGARFSSPDPHSPQSLFRSHRRQDAVYGGGIIWCEGGGHGAGAGGARLGRSEAGGAGRAWLLRCSRRARLRRGAGGGGGLDQGVRVRAAGGGVAAEARVARRRRRVRARDAAGDRAAGGDPGRVLDAAPPSPPHRPIRSWVCNFVSSSSLSFGQCCTST